MSSSISTLSSSSSNAASTNAASTTASFLSLALSPSNSTLSNTTSFYIADHLLPASGPQVHNCLRCFRIMPTDLEKKFEEACRSGFIDEVADMIHDIEYVNYGLANACFSGHKKIVENIVENCNYDRNCIPDALAHAAIGGNIEIIKYLSDYTRSRDDYWLCKYQAVKTGNTSIIELLTSYGVTCYENYN